MHLLRSTFNKVKMWSATFTPCDWIAPLSIICRFVWLLLPAGYTWFLKLNISSLSRNSKRWQTVFFSSIKFQIFNRRIEWDGTNMILFRKTVYLKCPKLFKHYQNVIRKLIIQMNTTRARCHEYCTLNIISGFLILPNLSIDPIFDPKRFPLSIF